MIEAAVRQLLLKVDIADWLLNTEKLASPPTIRSAWFRSLVFRSGDQPDAPGPPVVMLRVFAAFMEFDTIIGALHWRVFLTPLA